MPAGAVPEDDRQMDLLQRINDGMRAVDSLRA